MIFKENDWSGSRPCLNFERLRETGMKCQKNIMPEVGIEPGPPDWYSYDLPTELLDHLRYKAYITVFESIYMQMKKENVLT